MQFKGPAADAADELITKGDLDTKLAAADGDGLTEAAGVLAVGAGTGITVAADSVAITANYRSIAIPFHVAGTLTTGVKLPEFIAPVACTVVDMKGRCAAGSGVTYRPSKNGGTADGTESLGTAQTVVSTTQSVALAVGDRLGINVVNAGTSGADLSVTFWANIT